MMMYFTGGLLGAYATVSLDEPVGTTLDYILELAKIVGLGYFVKAFGENIAKIILSAVYGAQFPTAAVAVSNEIVEEGEEENGSA